MRDLFDLFTRDRRYTKGVSERTQDWYQQCWKAFGSVLNHATPETLTKSDFTTAIEAMRNRGVTPVTVNTYARAINGFLKWLHDEERCPKLLKVPRLKEPEVVIATYRPEQVQHLVSHRPTLHNHRRAQTVALVVIDTGMRLKEVLALRREDIDFDSLLITIRDGKGGKQRVVPYTTELRKVLFKYTTRRSEATGLVFCTRDGNALLQNNLRRDYRELCTRLRIDGVKGGYHVLRHTFAVNYVRRGGDVFRLQRILGHSTLEMTRRYVNLQTEDLQAVHDRLSLLTRGGR